MIIGGGPAGLTAAIYLARSRYRVLVVEREHFGGQIAITSIVVNYPGVGKASGPELTDVMRRQAEGFGAEFLTANVTSLDMEGDIKTVRTSFGDLRCFAVLLATGARPRAVGFDGEDRFRGHGVAYCATCDGEFFTGKDVFVVGGGFAAAEESVFLTKYARHVTVMMRRETFSCAAATAEAALTHPKITVMPNTEVVSVSGGDLITSIICKNNKTGEITERRADPGDAFGVFVLAGYSPETSLVEGLAELDAQGYVVTDRSQRTNVDGLFAAGDVCVKPLRQVVTAVGDGAIAATEMEKHAAAMQRKTGLVPKAPDRPTHIVDDETRSGSPSSDAAILTPDMRAQLDTMFKRMKQPLELHLYLGSDQASYELRAYMDELASLTDKLSVKLAPASNAVDLPCVRVCRSCGEWTGLAFHGVPGGHEFTSFVLGLYNASGPGQSLPPELLDRIKALAKPARLSILVTLSCTMCPDLVVAAQRIAAENPLVSAEVYDLNLYPEMREKYNVMSVPCILRDGELLGFGKKDIPQLLDLLGA